MAAHISVDGPKTEFQKEKESQLSNPDKLSKFYMERIDTMDPSVG